MRAVTLLPSPSSALGTPACRPPPRPLAPASAPPTTITGIPPSASATEPEPPGAVIATDPAIDPAPAGRSEPDVAPLERRGHGFTAERDSPSIVRRDDGVVVHTVAVPSAHEELMIEGSREPRLVVTHTKGRRSFTLRRFDTDAARLVAVP